jgi:hypothetical protein
MVVWLFDHETGASNETGLQGEQRALEEPTSSVPELPELPTAASRLRKFSGRMISGRGFQQLRGPRMRIRGAGLPEGEEDWSSPGNHARSRPLSGPTTLALDGVPNAKRSSARSNNSVWSPEPEVDGPPPVSCGTASVNTQR